MPAEAMRHIYLRRIVAPVLRALGPTRSERVVRRLSAGVADLQTPSRAVAEARIREAVGRAADPAKVRHISRGMYDNIARFWIEALFVRRKLGGAGWRRHVSVNGEDRLESFARSGRGCLLATAYFGNPAAAAVALGQIFRPVHVVADFFGQPQLRAWQGELYSLPTIRIIERRAAGEAIPGILKSGGAVFLICEQERARGSAIEVPFLGRTVRCYPTLDRLAKWFNVPTVAVACHRNDTPLSFTLDVAEIVDGECEDGEVTRRTMAALESAILRRPEQYLWSIPTAQRRTQVTRTGSASASCPRKSRTASVMQMPSAAGTPRGDSAAAVGPVPMA